MTPLWSKSLRDLITTDMSLWPHRMIILLLARMAYENMLFSVVLRWILMVSGRNDISCILIERMWKLNEWSLALQIFCWILNQLEPCYLCIVGCHSSMTVTGKQRVKSGFISFLLIWIALQMIRDRLNSFHTVAIICILCTACTYVWFAPTHSYI